MSTLLDSIRGWWNAKTIIQKHNSDWFTYTTYLLKANTWKIYTDSKKLRDESLGTCVLDHFLLILRVIFVIHESTSFRPQNLPVISAIIEESFREQHWKLIMKLSNQVVWQLN